MEILFIGIVAFLLILAIFDLSVGVSNDAVNFLNSAIGSKAASFKRIIIVASVGVFLGATMSNGMIDIARHGIFHPEYFSFYEVLSIFMAVMIVDIILLDIFNSLALPTSTTVSMVFELLGASFAVALIKMAHNTGAELPGLAGLLNTDKALTIIIGIFLSVVIAFIFGCIVQFIVRAIFSFKKKACFRAGAALYGGVAATIIIYFLLIKGAKDLLFMTEQVKGWIGANLFFIIGGCFIATTLIMRGLQLLKVNVLRVVVLLGTFSLAMAFAGNDLVNFIGVPLTGLASFLDFHSSGASNAHSFMMTSLNSSAHTPIGFLIAAGCIMVVALTVSKKARQVAKTEIGLGCQKGGDELFGSSRVARHLVRGVVQVGSFVKRYTPKRVTSWFSSRFDTSEIEIEPGASFDLIRASVNMVLSALLIALGTSLKLPLSTTFVTFMVAMGTSLSDRAWGRESAVFRITGVISVIGGWFITAGAAFICAAIVAAVMIWGGYFVIVALVFVAIYLLIRSNKRFQKKQSDKGNDILFQTILSTKDQAKREELFVLYFQEQQLLFLEYALKSYEEVTSGFIEEDLKKMWRAARSLGKEKAILKTARRKQTLCFRELEQKTIFENSAWFHLVHNSCMSMTYNIRRINEVCLEHVDNNFRPLPQRYKNNFVPIKEAVIEMLKASIIAVKSSDEEAIKALRLQGDNIKDVLSGTCRQIYGALQRDNTDDMAATYVYLNLLQETEQMVSSLRKLLRANSKMFL